MDKMRQWTMLTVLAVLVVLVAGYFLLVRPKADQATELRATAEATRVANVRLQQEIARLTKQAQDLPRQQARLAAFAARIPTNPALPSLIRALTDAADTAGVELVSLAPAAPKPYTPPGATTAAATAATPTEQILFIPLTVSIIGGYVQVQQFLSNLEDLQRTMLVETFAISPPATSATGAVGATAAGLTVALNGRVFMTLPAAAAAPAPVPVVPAPVQPTPAQLTPAQPAPAQPTASATPAQ